MIITNLNQDNSCHVNGFESLLKRAVDCTDQSCSSGAYFVEQNDGQALYNLGTTIGGPQTTVQMGKTTEWSESRYAILIAKGNYTMNGYFKLGYYTQVAGVSDNSDSVILSPGINVLNNCVKAFNADGSQNSRCYAPGGLDNFWRSLSDLKMNIANDPVLRFAVSQASPIRDINIEGSAGILMCDWNTDIGCGYTSGGFIDKMKASSIGFGSQQQFYISNSQSNQLIAGAWNILSNNNNVDSITGAGDVNVQNRWPGYPFTKIDDTTMTRFQKPKLVKDGDQWHVQYDYKASPISDFIVVQLNQKEDRTKISSYDVHNINNQLINKVGMIVMPGIYDLDDTLYIPNNKIVLGIGLPSFVCPPNTGKCMITESEGIRIAGLVFDSPVASSLDTNSDAIILNIGEEGSGISTNPVVLQDVYCRIAHIKPEQIASSAYSCVKVNADYTIGENLWLWRADHDAKFINVLANAAKAPYGLIVHGNNVKMYGLFVEHFLNYQTVWFGKNGQVNFYQSEIPYYLPEGGITKCSLPYSDLVDETPACASLYITKSATGFTANGLGIYSYFPNKNERGSQAGEKEFYQDTIRAKSAIIVDAENVVLTHGLTHFLDGDLSSGIDNVIQYKSNLYYPENSYVNGSTNKIGYAFDEFRIDSATVSSSDEL
ncbi:uncharacterized protein TRIADDRAFT_62513 [Trichoplax adhaerens]|uniref:Uncharacterized protein n=1 Tax=Trichoplax adhaerens TaxID=10228 RepID=B3SE08_TRIAD|nr:hypothetical protein TRIADDRAFT_62513 [Trichoplax adhaerens]EDV19038.1 hypothetical protein TRIADDRAFT_62513 [Trichoplax adhaerens]|eukprot:XP_002118477.1 hypothetical protein TRIADDRAFT_62513 [Trichoplax adhaerens]